MELKRVSKFQGVGVGSDIVTCSVPIYHVDRDDPVHWLIYVSTAITSLWDSDANWT